MSRKKGSAATVILVLVVAAIAVAILLANFGGKFPSFPGGSSVSYDNTIITITDKLISDLQPLSCADYRDGKCNTKSETSLIFFVTNKGDKTVDLVDVKFADVVGFKIKSLQCHQDDLSGMVGVRDESDSDEGGRGGVGDMCELKKIVSGDSREVRAVLNPTVDLKPTDQPSPASVKYKIAFPYSGNRFAQVPVVGSEKDLPAGVQFLLSKPTVGPVQADVEPPVGAKRVVGSGTVDENFAREGLTFTVKFKFSDAGAPNGNKEPVAFMGDSFRVRMENAEVLSCDKKTSVVRDTATIDVKNEKLPFEVKCTMRPTVSSIQAYAFATLDVQYDYTYSFTVSDANFEIMPPLKTETGTQQ